MTEAVGADLESRSHPSPRDRERGRHRTKRRLSGVCSRFPTTPRGVSFELDRSKMKATTDVTKKMEKKDPLRIDDADLVTLDEAANILGLSRRTVQRYIAADWLPAYRHGARYVRIHRDDIRALIQQL